MMIEITVLSTGRLINILIILLAQGVIEALRKLNLQVLVLE